MSKRRIQHFVPEPNGSQIGWPAGACCCAKPLTPSCCTNGTVLSNRVLFNNGEQVGHLVPGAQQISPKTPLMTGNFYCCGDYYIRNNLLFQGDNLEPISYEQVSGNPPLLCYEDGAALTRCDNPPKIRLFANGEETGFTDIEGTVYALGNYIIESRVGGWLRIFFEGHVVFEDPPMTEQPNRRLGAFNSISGNSFWQVYGGGDILVSYSLVDEMPGIYDVWVFQGVNDNFQFYYQGQFKSTTRLTMGGSSTGVLIKDTESLVIVEPGTAPKLDNQLRYVSAGSYFVYWPTPGSAIVYFEGAKIWEGLSQPTDVVSVQTFQAMANETGMLLQASAQVYQHRTAFYRDQACFSGDAVYLWFGNTQGVAVHARISSRVLGGFTYHTLKYFWKGEFIGETETTLQQVFNQGRYLFKMWAENGVNGFFSLTYNGNEFLKRGKTNYANPTPFGGVSLVGSHNYFAMGADLYDKNPDFDPDYTPDLPDYDPEDTRAKEFMDESAGQKINVWYEDNEESIDQIPMATQPESNYISNSTFGHRESFILNRQYNYQMQCYYAGAKGQTITGLTSAISVGNLQSKGDSIISTGSTALMELNGNIIYQGINEGRARAFYDDDKLVRFFPNGNTSNVKIIDTTNGNTILDFTGTVTSNLYWIRGFGLVIFRNNVDLHVVKDGAVQKTITNSILQAPGIRADSGYLALKVGLDLFVYYLDINTPIFTDTQNGTNTTFGADLLRDWLNISYYKNVGTTNNQVQYLEFYKTMIVARSPDNGVVNTNNISSTRLQTFLESDQVAATYNQTITRLRRFKDREMTHEWWGTPQVMRGKTYYVFLTRENKIIVMYRGEIIDELTQQSESALNFAFNTDVAPYDQERLIIQERSPGGLAYLIKISYFYFGGKLVFRNENGNDLTSRHNSAGAYVSAYGIPSQIATNGIWYCDMETLQAVQISGQLPWPASFGQICAHPERYFINTTRFYKGVADGTWDETYNSGGGSYLVWHNVTIVNSIVDSMFLRTWNVDWNVKYFDTTLDSYTGTGLTYEESMDNTIGTPFVLSFIASRGGFITTLISPVGDETVLSLRYPARYIKRNPNNANQRNGFSAYTLWYKDQKVNELGAGNPTSVVSSTVSGDRPFFWQVSQYIQSDLDNWVNAEWNDSPTVNTEHYFYFKENYLFSVPFNGNQSIDSIYYRQGESVIFTFTSAPTGYENWRSFCPVYFRDIKVKEYTLQQSMTEGSFPYLQWIIPRLDGPDFFMDTPWTCVSIRNSWATNATVTLTIFHEGQQVDEWTYLQNQSINRLFTQKFLAYLKPANSDGKRTLVIYYQNEKIYDKVLDKLSTAANLIGCPTNERIVIKDTDTTVIVLDDILGMMKFNGNFQRVG